MNNNIEQVELATLEKASEELPSFQTNEIDSTDTEYIKMIFNDIMKSKQYTADELGLNYITDYGEIRVDFKDKAFYLFCDICDDSCNMIKWNDNVFKLMSQPLKQRIYNNMRRARIRLNLGGRE